MKILVGCLLQHLEFSLKPVVLLVGLKGVSLKEDLSCDVFLILRTLVSIKILGLNNSIRTVPVRYILYIVSDIHLE